jgi:hypothetical protein
MKSGAGRRMALLVMSGSLTAEVALAADEPRPDSYGTTSDTMYVMQAYEFVPETGAGTNLIANSFGSRACSSPCTLVAPVMLPAGAIVHEMELESCDSEPTAQVVATLFRQEALEQTSETLVTVGSVDSGGCTRRHNPIFPHTVANFANSYRVVININGGTSLATRFQAVRLFYRLQVSPPPATATFPNDVPTTHPFFRFIEALAAANITAGCGPGSYCPNNPVTRGEMAVFLATALGLHFAD